MCVERRRQPIRGRDEELRHRLLGLLRERQQHGRVRLVVDERDLGQPPVDGEPEPARVRPEEVVEVAERIRVHGGPASKEARDLLAVAGLDDVHGASVENRPVRAVVQRVSRAEVRVDGETVGVCGAGLLVLVGAGTRTPKRRVRLAAKVARLRIFPDDEGRFDGSLVDTGGEALVVSQFTLLADTRKGQRPSFTDAAPATSPRRSSTASSSACATSASGWRRASSARGWRSSSSTTAR